MNEKTYKYIPFMEWIIEVAEEKIVEHRLIKQGFKTNEEFIIFTIIWLRVYKNIFQKIKIANLENNVNVSSKTLDQFFKNYYKNQDNIHLGITINAIARESLIPRSTAKRIIEGLIEKHLVERNSNRLIIPTSKVRDIMKKYRQFIFKSHKKTSTIFNNLNLKDIYDENDSF